jgi:hypothetical protein
MATPVHAICPRLPTSVDGGVFRGSDCVYDAWPTGMFDHASIKAYLPTRLTDCENNWPCPAHFGRSG